MSPSPMPLEGFAGLFLSFFVWAAVMQPDMPTCGHQYGWNELTPPSAALPWVRSSSEESVISLAPSVASPRVILAGGLTGLYRSEDCGVTWQIIKIDPVGGIPKRDSTVRIAVDSHDAYYTWDSRGPMFVSRNQGATWEAVRAARQPGDVAAYFYASVTAVSPLGSGVLYAESFQLLDVRNPPPVGLWRSYDGGRSWEPVDIASQRPDPASSVEAQQRATTVDAQEVTLLYGVTSDGRLIMSRDAAATWESFSLGKGCELRPSEVWRSIKQSVNGDRFWLTTNLGKLMMVRVSDSDCVTISPPSAGLHIEVIAPDPFDSSTVYVMTSESESWRPWVYRTPTQQKPLN